MEKHIINFITTEQAKKKAARVVPNHVKLVDIINNVVLSFDVDEKAVKIALSELYKSGKLKYTNTINHICFNVI